MEQGKCKSATTSVPTISVKFLANAEQIEDFYTGSGEEEDPHTVSNNEASPSSASESLSGTENTSPLNLLPKKFVKRSTSIDVGNAQHLDASPPSDPWRFFSDIKGKITKSVEEKITEIKSRNQEEGSPQHKNKTIRDGKESASVSDSDDLSESSISKTCGAVSTTEGVEMSSDEDTTSLDKDTTKKPSTRQTTMAHSPSSGGGLRHRFRFLRTKKVLEEGTVKEKHLSKIYNVNVDDGKNSILREDEVESGVEALEEEADLKKGGGSSEVLKIVAENIDNFVLDGNVLQVREVQGSEIREDFFDCKDEMEEKEVEVKTVFAPYGFVDLRPFCTTDRPCSRYLHLMIIFLSITIYSVIQYYSPYIAGLTTGMIISYIFFRIASKLNLKTGESSRNISPSFSLTPSSKILEVQAVSEYQPLQKYEGWINEYPDVYNAETYHISHTQSVFLRLQGNLLRISHSKTKVAKRAMWNEPEINATFTHHRIYNLLGATIALLPQGLAKKRHWSKKYPICITLAKDQMCFDSGVLAKIESEDEKHHLDKEKLNEKLLSVASSRSKKTFSRFRKKDYSSMAQRFSKLTDDDAFDFDSDSRASTPSGASDVTDPPPLEDLLTNGEDFTSLPEDECTCSQPPQECSPDEIKIYLFGRTDREKEDWFRRLTTATHKGVGVWCTDDQDVEIKEVVSSTLIEAAQTELEYLKYMTVFKSLAKIKSSTVEDASEQEDERSETKPEQDLLWMNALIGRVLFDCVRNSSFIEKVKDRIQRKLSTIKLPYFIEELLIPELSLGQTPPFVKRAGEPMTDERGLWIDLDVTYEGSIVLTLQTKLNLMRLKNPQAYERNTKKLRSAIYHSDVDDSAESSSDEEGPQQEIPNLLQDPTLSVSSSSSGSGGRKFIKMVDRLAESKLFQAATDNKYIKKAMEGVSNTELRLTVEVKSIIGTVVLNIPPPPTDRIWIGFRPLPEIALSARPIVGERHLSYIMVTSWIEKKLLLEFQKIMVIPNMEDFVIPVMNPKLPE